MSPRQNAAAALAVLLTLGATSLTAQQATAPRRTGPSAAGAMAQKPAAATAAKPITPSTAPSAAVTVKEAAPGLLAKAAVRPEAAEQTALAQVPSGRVTGAVIEQRSKELVYVFTVADAAKKSRHVTINAATGSVIPMAGKPAGKRPNG